MGKSPKTSNSRVWLKITQKKEILKFHEENPGYSYRKLADIFSEKLGKKLNHSHIYRAIKNSERILKVTGKMEKRKKMVSQIMVRFMQEVYDEFLKRINFAPVTTEILLSIAVEIAENNSEYRESFSKNGKIDFSPDWVATWKQSHGVRWKKIKGERKFFPAADIETAQKDTARIIDQYPQKYVFNSDTSNIHPKYNGAYSLQPAKKQFHIKKGDNKSRVSVNSMVNGTGCFNNSYLIVKNYSRDLTTERSIITEIPEKRLKYGNPMKGGFERRTYLCEDGTEILIYRNKNAWVTKKIHEDYMKIFNQMVLDKYGNVKVLLILDNFSGHKIDYSQFPNIDIHFLPPNLTGYMQPLDMAYFSNFKEKFYKWRKLELHRLRGHEPDFSVIYSRMIQILNGTTPLLIKTLWKMAKIIPEEGSDEEQELIAETTNNFEEFFFENAAESRPPDDFDDSEQEIADDEVELQDPEIGIETQQDQLQHHELPLPDPEIFAFASQLNPSFECHFLSTPSPVIYSPRNLPKRSRNIAFRPYE